MDTRVVYWVALLSMGGALAEGEEIVGKLELKIDDDEFELSVDGDKDDAWVFESSSDLVEWARLPDVKAVYSDEKPVSVPKSDGAVFFRAKRFPGFYDTSVVQTISIAFEESNWRTILDENYADATFLAGEVTYDGFSYPEVGIRYKGNTSYRQAGEKKSIAIDMEYLDANFDIMGYESFNFNNAHNDESMMREALYFNSIKDYCISPAGGFINLEINGENWGLYSNAQQQDGVLIEEWFDDYDGDRWKAASGTGAGGGDTGPGGGGGRPPGGGGGGGGQFASGDVALMYLGDNSSDYPSEYELKKDGTGDAWGNLIAVAKLLDETDPSSSNYRETMETKFAVDEWLWFIAAENIFTDADGYYSKGRDYQIYFDPEAGRMHPVEHDGNEAFTVGQETLSPLDSANDPNRPVIYKFLNDPELKQRYFAHFRTILDEKFNPEYMDTLIEAYRTVISSAVDDDPKRGFTFATHNLDISNLKSHIQSRYDYLRGHADIGKSGPTVESVTLLEVPAAGEPAPVVASVSQHDSEGIDSVRLYYRVGDVGGYTDVEMYDDGLHDDGAANDGLFGGVTAGYQAGQKVRYYVEAISGNSDRSVTYFPARAESDPLKFEIVTADAVDTKIVINEFMASNDTALADPQGDYDDWIELKNLTDAEFDLSGMFLTDNANNPRKWEIPAGTTIPANGFLIVWADEDGSDEGLHANFKLSASGEEILIVDTDANWNVVLDRVEFGAQAVDTSYGRLESGSNTFDFMTPTPGAENLGE
ncbi:CotH kinase family protein [Pelagicoccus mobilis]|uniref:CotH kinase family protein n=1 Tax=Pelagicoccus mobilis TaxID=415221 RepID=A0A934RY04_9BACT|nr:CotH kinase family protein [Pelagicoccus mobilis]MBK1875949.1 CotH kinase family protein [Pelagicoccus mobilis]